MSKAYTKPSEVQKTSISTNKRCKSKSCSKTTIHPQKVKVKSKVLKSHHLLIKKSQIEKKLQLLVKDDNIENRDPNSGFVSRQQNAGHQQGSQKSINKKRVLPKVKIDLSTSSQNPSEAKNQTISLNKNSKVNLTRLPLKSNNKGFNKLSISNYSSEFTKKMKGISSINHRSRNFSQKSEPSVKSRKNAVTSNERSGQITHEVLQKKLSKIEKESFISKGMVSSARLSKKVHKNESEFHSKKEKSALIELILTHGRTEPLLQKSASDTHEEELSSARNLQKQKKQTGPPNIFYQTKGAVNSLEAFQKPEFKVAHTECNTLVNSELMTVEESHNEPYEDNQKLLRQNFSLREKIQLQSQRIESLQQNLLQAQNTEKNANQELSRTKKEIRLLFQRCLDKENCISELKNSMRDYEQKIDQLYSGLIGSKEQIIRLQQIISQTNIHLARYTQNKAQNFNKKFKERGQQIFIKSQGQPKQDKLRSPIFDSDFFCSKDQLRS